MKHITIKFVTLVALLGLIMPVSAQNRPVNVRVMSQNLYIGANLERLLNGEPPAVVLQTVQQTNFPARAVEIARAIDEFRPDLIGLQEVSLVTISDASGNVLFELDFLSILMNALAARGEYYTIASTINNADITLPVDPSAGTVGRVLDRDVILTRDDTTRTRNSTAANFTDNLVVDIAGFPVKFTRGYTAVDARVRGKNVRFVNTHLEVENYPCVTASGLQVCQDLQAAELVDEFADEQLPVIVVGDLNAEPGTSAYQTIADAGYIDTWTIRYPYNNEPGYTCCQAEDLAGSNLLAARIDHIFVKDSEDFPIFSAITTVVGDWEQRRTAGGLWYSDHGGPWAKLRTRR